jgi:monomeric sarcosine oxidase
MYDVIVVGLGGVGSAAAWHLARRKARVLGLDQYPPAHDRGSSHGQTRVIRQAYFEHPDYVPLLLRAYDLWRELEQRQGQKLLFQVGLLQVGPPQGVVIPGVLRSAAEHRLVVEKLTAAEAHKRFCGFTIPSEMVAVYEPAAGYLLVEDCVRCALAAAADHGADLRHGVKVCGWQVGNDSVAVHTEQTTYRAARLVLALGPWSRPLAQLPENVFQVRRKHVYWFATHAPAYQASAGCPTFLFETPDGVFYGFPQIDAWGVKVAEHSGGVTIDDPSGDPRVADPADQRRVEAFITRSLPGVSRTCLRHSVCFYTMSPDEHFVLDFHPFSARVVFAAGLSGHGFKFASVLGEALADLALEGKTSLPIGFLRWSRLPGTWGG